MMDIPTAEAPWPAISTSAVAIKARHAIRSLQDARNRGQQLAGESAALNETAALDLNVRAYIDEVFLVLALLGEALLPLQIFDNEHYPAALDDVETSILGSGHEVIHVAFKGMSAELQYVVTAGLAFCAIFAPMPVYRGFGAAVLGDWHWGNPNPDGTMMKKMATKTGAYLGLLKDKGDPQPNKVVLLAFDKIVYLLQIKQLLFLRHKPVISGFAEQQPRYVPRKEKDVRDQVERLEDWTKYIEKIGHPGPGSFKVTSWAIPYATWNSSYSCKMFQTRGCWETIMTNQMDPGRLLHAFVCRNNINLVDGQVLVLPPGSPAECLACWLEGLPGMLHHILKWQDLNTDKFSENCSKSLRKRLGQFPLPDRFAMRDNKIALRPPMPIQSLTTCPTPPKTTSPPPYSEDGRLINNEQWAAPRAVELSPERDPVELAANIASSHNRRLQGVALASTLNAGSHVPAAVACIRPLAYIRRKPSPATSADRHPSVIAPKPLLSGGAKPAVPDESRVAVAGSSQSSSLLQASNFAPVELPTDRDPVELGTSSIRQAGKSSKEQRAKQVPMQSGHNLEADNPNLNLEQNINTDDGMHTSTVLEVQHKVSQLMRKNDITEDRQISGNNETRVDQVQTGQAMQPSKNADSNTYLDILNRVARGEITPQALQEMLQSKLLLTP